MIGLGFKLNLTRGIKTKVSNIGTAIILLLTGTAPDAVLGTSYTFTPTRVGGKSPYTYAITTGTLPAWATLNTTTGAITGTPS